MKEQEKIIKKLILNEIKTLGYSISNICLLLLKFEEEKEEIDENTK